jgi:hypothetical protein
VSVFSPHTQRPIQEREPQDKGWRPVLLQRVPAEDKAGSIFPKDIERHCLVSLPKYLRSSLMCQTASGPSSEPQASTYFPTRFFQDVSSPSSVCGASDVPQGSAELFCGCLTFWEKDSSEV